MNIAMLSTVAWQTPPRHYGPWESVVSLLTEGLVARGIDVDNITHVINYELPETYDHYLHRIGRTGRAGKKGKALTFVN